MGWDLEWKKPFSQLECSSGVCSTLCKDGFHKNLLSGPQCGGDSLGMDLVLFSFQICLEFISQEVTSLRQSNGYPEMRFQVGLTSQSREKVNLDLVAQRAMEIHQGRILPFFFLVTKHWFLFKGKEIFAYLSAIKIVLVAEQNFLEIKRCKCTDFLLYVLRK